MEESPGTSTLSLLKLKRYAGLPEYEDYLLAAFQKRFKGLCDRAAAEGRLANTSGSSSTSAANISSSDQGIKSGAATSTAPALTASPVVLLDDKANLLTPNMYAVEHILTLFEVAFGTATQQQENEFKALKQGSMTPDGFAYELEYRSRTLLHRNYSDGYLVQLFVNGLQDRECAASLQQALQYANKSQVNLERAKDLVKSYQEHKQQQLQVLIESNVVASMLGKAACKQSLSGGVPEGQLTEYQRMQLLMK
ncbi:hypothetical protein COO60DRAFT_1641236 [Scenedesmus sp. NREL 46B-D3]|nr:hypothetical protein COO60DRAFT_1641236 [Scenedesmus sp. NREL 46B-D3]